MTVFALEVAERRIKEFERRVEECSNQEKDLMARHREAMESYDCEDFLQLGIDAYQWLRRADSILRKAASEGRNVSDDAKAAIDTCYKAWLAPCERAEALIRQQQERNYEIRNLNRFREAVAAVKAQLCQTDIYDAIEEAFNGVPFWTAGEESHQ